MSALLQPFTVRDRTFRNRIVMPPMVSGLADAAGQVTEKLVQHYAARAQAGVGFVIVEAAAVDAGGRCWPTGLNIYDDTFLPGLRRLTEAIHAKGAVAGIQLVHGGPQAQAELSGGFTVGPSAVPPASDATTPVALTVEEIRTIEDRFVAAAARAVSAGFDVVEVHGAHGYLLDSFLSSTRNTRTDAYGGTLENRLRILLETCTLVHACIGDAALLDCRISFYNKRQEPFTVADFHHLARALAVTGIDLLHLSTDGAFNGYFGAESSLGQLAREATSLPLIVAGGLGNPFDADRLIAEGHADFAAIGKSLFDDPAWAFHAKEMLGE